MFYFGKSWGAPICHQISQGPTPAGQCCGWCGEVFVEGDQDLTMPSVESVDPPKAGFVSFHLECHLRQIVGSVGHQTQRCSCFGGTEEDPPNVSKREAAKMAAELFEARQQYGL